MTPSLSLQVQNFLMLEFAIPLSINEVEKFSKIVNVGRKEDEECDMYVAKYLDDILIVYAEGEKLIDIRKISS